ncbi:hypothetical protein V6N12_068237 [Hibiscus sabdariffa]|uniref:Uncharacterized protein n=1 Tax=Hibiscus sabdariffa TaxID=183260 RepID=A0ABR2FPV6_9ROSI
MGATLHDWQSRRRRQAVRKTNKLKSCIDFLLSQPITDANVMELSAAKNALRGILKHDEQYWRQRSREVFIADGVAASLPIGTFSNCHEWILEVVSLLDRDALTHFATLLWSIWNWRNKWVHDGKLIPARIVVMDVGTLLADMTAARNTLAHHPPYTRSLTCAAPHDGTMKKAHEISVLCDADVALIVFSTKGKLFEFSSDSCMERILERYERYSYAERQLAAGEIEQNGSWTLEHAKLKARMEVLQRNQRHYMGEDLENLSLRELQNLEQQLDSALKHIRSKRNQLMFESISELQKKDKALQEQNNILAKKLKEREKEKDIVQQAQQNNCQDSSSMLLPQPMQSLNIRGTYEASSNGREDEDNPDAAHPNSNVLLPPWMIRPC